MNLQTWQSSKKRVASANDKLEKDTVIKEMLQVCEEEHPRFHCCPKWSAQGMTVSADDRTYMLGVIHGADYILGVLKKTGQMPPEQPKETPVTFQPPD
jgi:hypothetical protein